MEHRPRRPAKLWLLPVMLAAAGLCYLDNVRIERTQPVLRCPGLPAAFDGLKIAQISDLHGRSFGEAHAALLAAVRGAKPDIIALTGDLADEYTETATLRPLLEGLCAIAPTFYVTGNHEWGMAREAREALFALLAECGALRLENAYRVLQRAGERLILAGVDDPNGPAEQKTAPELVREIRAAEGEGAFLLVLCHRNDQLPLWAGLGADVVLSGHAHGGIVRIPGLGGVFGTHYELFPGDEAGLFTQGRTQLYVSRGLGPSHRLPIRVCNPPELAVVTLRRKEI